jgi:hypothetical protein
MVRPLKRLNQRIVFLERKRQSRMTQGHKREIHEKTILGGLIVKAGLKNADRAFLLGALIQASQIPVGTVEHDRLSALGTQAFRAEARARIKL